MIRTPSFRRYAVLAALLSCTGGSVAAQATGVPNEEREPTEAYVHEAWTVQHGLPVNSIHRVLQGPMGYLWLATWDGLVRFDGMRFIVYRTGSTEGLPSNRIAHLLQNSDGTLWMRTEQNHLVRMRSSEFTHFTAAQGLPDQATRQIYFDSDGGVWVGTDREAFRLAGERFVPVAEHAFHGEVTALLRDLEGGLWLGTRQDGRDSAPPPIVIEEVVTRERRLLPTAGLLALSAGERDFEIDYTALSLMAPENVRFRYRLEGLTSEWTDAGNRRTAFFTNVPPGRYTFRVVASNDDGVWNEEGAAMTLSIAPYLARAALPDLVVADVMMPELDGLAFARALKHDAITDAIPVLLLTARAAPEDLIAGFETGADAYLVKPFDPGVLEARVAALLAQRHRLRERFARGEATPPNLAPTSDRASQLEQRLRPLVEARLAEPNFSPEELAAVAGLSYHQLYRALRDELNTTPSHFIRTVRAECASALLRQGAGSVTEIAYAVGFESLSYFRRAFRERFGTSPSEHLSAVPPVSGP